MIMEPVLYMSQTVFSVIIYVVLAGLGGTVALLLGILFKEMKNHTLW